MKQSNHPEVSPIVIRDLHAGYSLQQVLTGINLEVFPKKITALIGPNGHGKTTLLRAISKQLEPSSGSIRIFDNLISDLNPHEIIKNGIIHISQGDHLYPSMTVKDNLLMGAYVTKSTEDLNKRIAFVLNIFPKLESLFSQRANSLSGGERRMLSLASGLMSEKRVLLIDEPALGLAPLVIEQIYQTIDKLKKEKYTILLVEENLDRVLEVADHIYLLNSGKIVFSGNVQEFEKNLDSFNQYFGI
mgnify:CR=1 FL=1